MSNTLLWAPLLSPENDGDFSFRLPDPDYHGPFRIDIFDSGADVYPFNITEIVDL